MLGGASRDSFNEVKAKVTRIPVSNKKPRDLTSFGFVIRRIKAEEPVATKVAVEPIPTKVEEVHVPAKVEEVHVPTRVGKVHVPAKFEKLHVPAKVEKLHVPTKVEKLHVPTPCDRDEVINSVPGELSRAFSKVLMSFGREEVEKFLNASEEQKLTDLERVHEGRKSNTGKRPFPFEETKKREKSKQQTLREKNPDFDPIVKSDAQRKGPLTNEYMDEVLEYVTEHPELSFEDVKGKFVSLKNESQVIRFKKFRAIPPWKIGNYVDLNNYCNEMVRKYRARGKSINDSDIRGWALEKAEELGLWRFVASPAWLRDFKDRNDLPRNVRPTCWWVGLMDW